MRCPPASMLRSPCRRRGAPAVGCGGTQGPGGIGGRATLRLSGRAGLGAHFVPTSLALQVNGEVSASLLESLAPDSVSDVSGRARIDAKVSEPWPSPICRRASNWARSRCACAVSAARCGRERHGRAIEPRSVPARNQSAGQRRRALADRSRAKPAACASSVCAPSWCWASGPASQRRTPGLSLAAVEIDDLSFTLS